MIRGELRSDCVVGEGEHHLWCYTGGQGLGQEVRAFENGPSGGPSVPSAMKPGRFHHAGVAMAADRLHWQAAFEVSPCGKPLPIVRRRSGR